MDWSYLTAGDIVAAGAALGKAIALSPNNADAWFHLGNAERGLGRFDAAAEGGGALPRL